MFENYNDLSADEKAQVKTIHRALRARTASRYGNLAWAFVRGFKYRRVERTTRTQLLADGTVLRHNPAYAAFLTLAIAEVVPGFAVIPPKTKLGYQPQPDAHPAVEAWLADELGAIEAPAPRVKKTFEPALPSQVA